MQDAPRNLTERHLRLLALLADAGDLESVLRAEPGATYLEIFDAARLALDEVEKRRHARLFDALRAWRRHVAAELEVPAFIVFPDKALWSIAEAHPTSMAELPYLWGVGEAKVDEFGSDVIRIASEYPDGDDVISPLAMSVLRFLASGHAIWQIQQAYPSLENPSLRERLTEVLTALEYRPGRGVKEVQEPEATAPQGVFGPAADRLGFGVDPLSRTRVSAISCSGL